MTDKSLGQHWLHDEDALDAVVAAAEVSSNDFVLEVGPGLGTLTEALLQTGAQVTAVEFDKRLIPQLNKKFATSLGSQLRIIQDDILKFDLATLPDGYKVVANIPYYLTSNLLRRFAESVNPPQTMSLLMQKEVAERVAAKPGDMSVLSVTTQWYYEPSLGPVVKAELFTPPPKVDSQILALTRRGQPLFANINTVELFKLAKAGFSERRKKLRTSLANGLNFEKNAVEKLCKNSSVDPNLRAQALSLEQWVRLYNEWQHDS